MFSFIAQIRLAEIDIFQNAGDFINETGENVLITILDKNKLFKHGYGEVGVAYKSVYHLTQLFYWFGKMTERNLDKSRDDYDEPTDIKQNARPFVGDGIQW